MRKADIDTVPTVFFVGLSMETIHSVDYILGSVVRPSFVDLRRGG